MEKTVDFKVYLTKENDVSSSREVRRFAIDSDVANHYMYLYEKLKVVFPELCNKHFNIAWQDSDRDYIRITNDEELRLALNEFQSSNQLCKLYVSLNSDNEYASEAKAMNQDVGPLHVGIVCDGCERDVRGFRYKCIECLNYDLCMDCESQGLHPEHYMIRSAMPLQRKSFCGRKLPHHVHKFMKRATAHSGKEEHGQKEYLYKNARQHRQSHRCSDNTSWLNTFATYLNDWANLPAEGICPSKEMPHESTEAKPDKSNESKENKNDLEPHVEFLKRIGENIAQFLDPLGIDINVQVKSDEPTPTTVPSGSSTAENGRSNQSHTENGATSNVPDKEKKLINDSENTKQSTSNTTPSSSVNVSPREEHDSGNEGWMLVSNNENFIPVASAITQPSECLATKATPKQELPSAPEETPHKRIYPELPTEENIIYHPDPKIQRSVEYLMQMGFSNENGWLTQLLISKGGNIDKVLNILLDTP